MSIKINKFIKLIIILGFIGFFTTNVSAQEPKNGGLNISTLDAELENKVQETIYGTENQLARVNKNTMKFIKKIAFGAHQSSREYGLYPSVTIAQAVLESASGTSGLSIAPYYNLFGIKGAYQGKSVTMRTMEDDGTGKLFEIYANFKSYPSWDASIKDHNELLRNGLNGYYSRAWRINARTPAQSAAALQGKYATDTAYASKIMNIINIYNLERFDRYLTERDLEWLNSDSLDPWELPIVENYVPEKVQTWGSGYLETPLHYIKRVRAASPVLFESDWDRRSSDKYYVKETLELENDFFEKDHSRTKRNPEIGDILLYKTENSENVIIEKYAVVERIFRDKLLISEGVSGEKGIYSIYREIETNSLSKFEFIKMEGEINE